MIIVHTEVSYVLRGQNAGKKIVLGAVAFAEKNHLSLSFLKSVFDRNILTSRLKLTQNEG